MRRQHLPPDDRSATFIRPDPMVDKCTLSWWSSPRLWLRAILMLDDTPHAIALGTAIGMFVALTPTVGIQMVMVLTLAVLTRRLFHFNKVAGLITVYVSNPLTIVPIYWFCYKVGTIYFPSTITREEFAAIFEYEGLREWWRAITRLFVDVGGPLIVGSLIVASLAALITYPLMRRLLRRIRRPRERSLGGDGGAVNSSPNKEALRV